LVMASQSASITAAAMTNILDASSAVVSPYSSSKLKVKISQVYVDANGNATVDWSKGLNTAERAKGTAVTLPSALAVPDTYVIWAEAEYAYEPTFGYAITGTLNLTDQLYMRPRLSTSVKYPAT
jgi:Flp pilus assembly protein TadG